MIQELKLEVDSKISPREKRQRNVLLTMAWPASYSWDVMSKPRVST